MHFAHFTLLLSVNLAGHYSFDILPVDIQPPDVLSGNSIGAQNNSITFDALYTEPTNSLQHQSLLQMYTIKAAGLDAKPLGWNWYESGIYSAKSKKLIGFSRSYNVITMDKGEIVHRAFDVYKADASKFADYLKSIPNGKTVVIATVDEPKTNRLLEGLRELIYNIGGSSKVFGDNIMVRSAYVLVGQKGIGEGNGKEYYRGSVDSDANAWLAADIFVAGDTIISESAVGRALIETVKLLGNKARMYPSPEYVYQASASKPLEVVQMEERKVRGKQSQVKAVFLV